MSLTFTQSILRTVVAKICHDVGWHSAHVSTLNVLSDLLNFYLKKLVIYTIESANHAGRSEPVLEDIAMTFKMMSIDLNQLQDYVLNVESSSLEFSIPLYPLPNRPNRIFDNVGLEEERPEYYDDWLPSLNSKVKSLEFESHNNLKILNDQIDSNDKVKNDETAEESVETFENKEKQIKNDDEIEPETPAEDDQKSQKLVFKFSLGKSLEENANQETSATNAESSNKTTLFQSASSGDIVNHLISSKAYIKFVQNFSSSTSHLDNIEIREKLRFSDTQRLPSNYKSRENSPEPEPEVTDSVNNNNPIDILNNNREPDLNIKKLSKSFQRKKPKINETDEFGVLIKPNIKVKEIGKKERNKKESGEKPVKVKKLKDLNSAKQLSIKVTGFGLANEDNKVKDLNDEFINNTSVDEQNKNESTPKKRQYKRKPKEKSEKKPKKMKKSENQETNPQLKETLNPVFVPSPVSDASFQFFSPNSTNKKVNENEAAKTSISLSNTNDSLSKDTEISKPENSFSDFSGEESFGEFGDSNSKLSSSKKTVPRPSTNKRNKNQNQKKIVKSAEVVESSDSSSDDNVIDDKNPVSLLVNPELSESLDGQDSAFIPQPGNSNSSISPVNSPKSVPIADSSISESNIETNKLIKEEHKIKKPEKSENKTKDKHKKNKKHSKNKHREEKQQKKHKKTKDKDKEREKDATKKVKEKNKDKEKSFKPKLSIKFGQVPNVDPVPPPPEPEVIPPPIKEEESFPFEFKMTVKNDETKKKRPSKVKKNESDSREGLVFIKESKSKESKNKKNQIINVVPVPDDPVPVPVPVNTKLKESNNVEKTKKSKENESRNSESNEGFNNKSNKKEKSREGKKEKDSSHKKNENNSCILIRETIKVDSDDRIWICPKCHRTDDGTPMIGCDTCDEWYHYGCVGIYHEPSPDDPWFCPRCFEKQKKKFDKYQKKNEKQKAKQEDIITITPPVPPPTDVVTELTPSVSIFPIPGPSGQSLISPVTPGYKPTGRPRGRPRKDSSNLSKQPSLTITPIGPSPGNLTNDTSSLYNQQAPYVNPMDLMLASSAFVNNDDNDDKPKNIKEICPKCLIVDKLQVNMIGCDNCYQWYHWPCVGINSAPSPDSNWYCSKCIHVKKKRLWNEMESKSYNQTISAEKNSTSSSSSSTVEILPASKTRRIMNTSQDGNKIGTNNNQSSSVEGKWLCGTCKQATTNESNPRWIACDECDLWYHFVCEKILEVPSKEESWFCRNCIKKQKNIENQINSKSKRKF